MKFILILATCVCFSALATDIFTMPTSGTTPVTTDQKKADIKIRIINSNNRIFAQALAGVNFYFNALWHNADGLTPQQFMDAFTTDAATLVAKQAALISFLNTLRPGSVTLSPPHTLTSNMDGTVTVNP